MVLDGCETYRDVHLVSDIQGCTPETNITSM